MTRLLIVLCIFYMATTTTWCQTDTLSLSSEEEQHSRNTFLDLVEGKPGRAALYSLLIPGGGQVYNRSWWKVPIALGIDGFTIYNMITSRKRYKDADVLYRRALEDPTVGNASQLRSRRNSYRESYEYSWVYLFLGRLVGVVDAYVDRQFKDFDVSDDLSIRVIENPTMTGIGIVFHLDKQTKKR